MNRICRLVFFGVLLVLQPACTLSSGTSFRGTLMVGGKIKHVDTTAQTVNIVAPMGQHEVLQYDSSTIVFRHGGVASIAHLSNGQDVKIDYVRLPGGGVLAKRITVGYYIAHCSCGSSCACPLSRGCRVLRF